MNSRLFAPLALPRRVKPVLAMAACLCLTACGDPAPTAPTPTVSSEEPYIVRSVPIRTLKPAFAQVDSVDAVPARARIAGTLTDVYTQEGEEVARDAVIGLVADARLPIQARAEGAQAAALEAQLAQAKSDLKRFEDLHKEGYYPTQKLEQARSNVRSLEDQVRAARAQRAVTVEASAQGAILAPVDGKVLRLAVRRGAVVMAGEEIALIGSRFVLKLRLPERHAGLLSEGDEVEVEQAGGTRAKGRVRKIYPALADGRVEADVETEGLESRVYGERVRVWTPAETRAAIVVPSNYLTVRFGVDFARVRLPSGEVLDVVVRRGEGVVAEGIDGATEILAGLGPGDALVRP